MPLSTINCCKGFTIVALALLLAWPADAQERRFYTPPPLDSVQAVAAEHGMVVAQEKIAAQIGAGILRQGGNAVDAAVVANAIWLSARQAKRLFVIKRCFAHGGDGFCGW